MARVRSVSTHRRIELQGWQLAIVAPNAADAPSKLETIEARWHAAEVPGTAASALHCEAIDFDARDVWYRARFEAPEKREGEKRILTFFGLATIADVFVNGTKVLHSESMFEEHEVDVDDVLRETNEICIRFHALGPTLAKRRPRPRWRTALVESQNFRWIRTTLLGRVTWGPQQKVVGPWRPIVLETRAVVDRPKVDLRANGEGDVSISIAIPTLGEARIEEATLVVGEGRVKLAPDDQAVLRGELHLPNAERWWPATHGDPALHRARVHLRTTRGEVEIDAGSIGFRRLEHVTDDAGFALRINGVDVFCRGACWMPIDAVKLSVPRERLRAMLEAVRDAGMNMLRVVGPAIYEDDAFFDLCDELGILVWQDFMFANLDYPLADEAFAKVAKKEVSDVCDRLQAHPCVVVMCGSSDVQQQASMSGVERAHWIDPVFDRDFRGIVRSLRDDVVYLSSTPSGGDVPIHCSEGVSAYYGVGAYLRPLEDARRANVRFTSECLGFSNVPNERTVDAMFGDAAVSTRDPIWTSRVPRDRGAGWDFEDVRDHYLRVLFDVDPMRVRYADVQRYLALGRVTTAEVMQRALCEWRRARSSCKGALVWFLNDMLPSAGFGIVDAHGAPKMAYFSAKRACAPVAVLLSDEGLDGLKVHLVNDRQKPIEGELRVALYRDGRTKTTSGGKHVVVPAHGEHAVFASSLFDAFVDLTYAYRFGPPQHDVVVARLVVDGRSIADAFHFPLGLSAATRGDVGLSAVASKRSETEWAVRFTSEALAQFVAIDAPEFVTDDDGFHLEPGVARELIFRAKTTNAKWNAWAQPLNSSVRTKIVEAT